MLAPAWATAASEHVRPVVTRGRADESQSTLDETRRFSLIDAPPLRSLRREPTPERRPSRRDAEQGAIGNGRPGFARSGDLWRVRGSFHSRLDLRPRPNSLPHHVSETQADRRGQSHRSEPRASEGMARPLTRVPHGGDRDGEQRDVLPAQASSPVHRFGARAVFGNPPGTRRGSTNRFLRRLIDHRWHSRLSLEASPAIQARSQRSRGDTLGGSLRGTPVPRVPAKRCYHQGR